MLTSKQRSYLRGLANPLDPIFQIGKGGVTESLVQAISDALTARELLKVRMLSSVGDDIRHLAQTIADATQAEVVQTIGHNIVLYRRNAEKPRIELP
jgi:RNA-binding protein